MLSSPSVSVVLPAGEASPLLFACLAALRGQEPRIDDVVVVDDTQGHRLGSVDGARVVPNPGTGPYAARNAGWRATGSEVVLFLDVRSRPRPDWGRRLGQAFEDKSVALAGSDVTIHGGQSPGGRAGERHQFFRLDKYVQNGFFRPYFPTCNLAARRSDLEAVGGFRETRSGADADLCWRILARPGRSFQVVPEVLMEWVPRDTVRGYLEQNYRYGKSNRGLRRAWVGEGAPQAAPTPWPRLARQITRRAVGLGWATARRDQDYMAAQLGDGARLAFELGYRVAAQTERRGRPNPLGPGGAQGG